MRLAELAARHRVARWYRSDSGQRIDVSRDTLVAVLDALGVDTRGHGWITRAIRAFDEAAARRLVEPVVVAWDGIVDAAAVVDRAEIALTFEDGTQLDTLPARLPLGYHRLRVSTSGDTAEALVISAPVRSWAGDRSRRRYGVYAPTFALHRANEPGPGHLGHLRALIDWVAARGGDTVLTLPLLAAFLDEPQEISPYSPVSRLMWNELYATIDRPEQTAASPDLLDYRAAAEATRDSLWQAVRSVDADPRVEDALTRFLADRPDVVDYAHFRAAQARYGRNWRDWPPRLRAGDVRTSDVDVADVRYHCVAQWRMDHDLAAVDAHCQARGVLLGLDLAIGTHPDGYDVWRHASIFATKASTGAPPDSFFVGGQDWGFPPIVPAQARHTGHDYFRRALGHHLRHASLLRIDHLMGFNRVYWVPAGFPPTAGTYVEHAGDELFAIACLESHRAHAVLIGEDLGTVPQSTRRALRRHGLLGTWVAQGALEAVPPTGDFDRPPANSVASLNTHDMPTFAGFLAGADIDDRIALGQIDDATGATQHQHRAELVAATLRLFGVDDAPALLEALLDELGASAAAIVLVNLEDLWLETRPHNVPGTSFERPNWRRPTAFGVDELDRAPDAGRLLERLRASRAGAAPPNRAS